MTQVSKLRRYCTKHGPARHKIPLGRLYTTADYVAAFIYLNHLIP